MDNRLNYISDDIGAPIAVPGLLTDSHLYLFAFKADRERLDAILNTYLNEASLGKYDYRSLYLPSDEKTSMIFMVMARMGGVVQNPDNEVFGQERYSELSFWIPCYDHKAWSERKELRLRVYLPILFPDNFTAIATGREMYGFSKELGQFFFPLAESEPRFPLFWGYTLAFQKCGADQKAKESLFIQYPGPNTGSLPIESEAAKTFAGLNLISGLMEKLSDAIGNTSLGDIRHQLNALAQSEAGQFIKEKIVDAETVFKTIVGASAEHGVITDIGAASVALKKQLHDAIGSATHCLADGTPVSLLDSLFSGSQMSAIFLKQFPAVDNPAKAQSRAITEAPFKIQTFRAYYPPLLPVWPARFPPLESNPLMEKLGLRVYDDGTGESALAIGLGGLSMDFWIEPGITVDDVKPPRQKVAILGGGIGSLATAFGITETPNWQDKYDITLYQLGWRLGGKGASGRNPEIANRIEEHGLHIWLGFYENAFRMIRKCYAELDRAPNAPLASWDMAFKRQSTVAWEEYVKDFWTDEETWKTWVAVFLPNEATPGAPDPAPPVGNELGDHPLRFFYVFDHLIEECCKAVSQHVGQVMDSKKPGAEALAVRLKDIRDRFNPALGNLQPTLGNMTTLLMLPRNASNAIEVKVKTVVLLEACRQRITISDEEVAALLDSLPEIGLPNWRSAFWEKIKKIVNTLLTKLLEQAAPLFREFEALAAEVLAPIFAVPDAIRRILILMDLSFAMVRGIVKDGLILYGYQVINDLDFAQWLSNNGAAEPTVISAPVRAVYDLVFAFPDGVRHDAGGDLAYGGDLAAGEALHGTILMCFCYKGAIMWKMQAGMGDTIMTPLYQVLKQRGVHFKFFRKVTGLELTEDKKLIGKITMNVQATTYAEQYNPLYDVKGLACWPSRPLYEQIVQGKALYDLQVNLESAWSTWPGVGDETLVLGQDFDQVVLGISVAALPPMTEPLNISPQWQDMLDHANTTATQAMQLWMSCNLEETGWPWASPVLDAYAEPFNTWANMDQTLDKETWPQNALPFSIAYFCNNLKGECPTDFSDPTYPKLVTAKVEKDGAAWLNQYARHLWPFTVAPGAQNETGFDWSLLVDIWNRPGEARINGQYFRANIDPTERYVTTAADTVRYRLKTYASGFDNLFLAGDWIDNETLNVGCVESTVISGLRAARALTGVDLPIAFDAMPDAIRERGNSMFQLTGVE